MTTTTPNNADREPADDVTGLAEHAIRLVLDPLRHLDQLRPAPDGWDDDELATQRHFARQITKTADLLLRRARAALHDLPPAHDPHLDVMPRGYDLDLPTAGICGLRWRLEEALAGVRRGAPLGLVAFDVQRVERLAEALIQDEAE